MALFIAGWGTRIRTLVGGVRVRSPTARRSPKFARDFIAGTLDWRELTLSDRPDRPRACN